MNIKLNFLIGLVLVSFGGNSLHAQGPQPQADKPATGWDKRLPPVLPGEVVETQQGNKMKVWSSAGPVPISTPFGQVQPNSQPSGIIVDGRGNMPQRNPGPQ